MSRRFIIWIFLASAALLGLGAVVLTVSDVVREAEAAARESALLAGPLALALEGLEPRPELLPPLLRRSLSEGAAATALELLSESDATASHPVYAAAALFELDRDQESLRLWPGAAAASGFERRLSEARSLREQGVEVLVRDRRGRLLGGLHEDGAFTFAAGVAPELVPRRALEDLERHRTELHGVRLTVDLHLSRLAQEALRGYQGSIVLLHIATGDVVAAVTDPRTHAKGGSATLEERREPASIAKLITTSAALRAGIDPDAAIASMRCRGSIRLAGQILYCSSIDGRLRGLDHALAVSCNVAFAQLGVMVGAERMIDEYRRYGFGVGDEEGHPLLGRLHDVHLDDRELGDLAIGLKQADITPLHAALVASTMARGALPSPHLLARADGYLGVSPHEIAFEPAAPLGSWVLRPAWTGPLHHAMAQVVGPGGTAARVDDPRYPVIMKTGTGRDPGQYFHVNYIGVGPMPAPELAFAVRITGERTSRRVRRAGYQVTQRLLAGLGDEREPGSVTVARARSNVGSGVAGFGGD